MNLILIAFEELFPNQNFKYTPILKYNRKLGDYNANARIYNNILQLNLNQKWENIDEEIKIGLIQTLLVRMLAKKDKIKPTIRMDLYHNFIKKLPLATLKDKTNPELEQSFNRVNQIYFYGLMEIPNLKWGTESKRKLASYNFHNDTVTISTIFEKAPESILDYLMYHELLHKKQKFQYNNGKNYFHTHKFRQEEKKYLNQTQIEKQIKEIIAYSSRRRSRLSEKLLNLWKH